MAPAFPPRAARLLGAAAVAALACLTAFAGPASARTLRGTSGADLLIGTAEPDVLLGLGGSDYLESRRGDDFLDGGAEPDVLFGGSGADRIQAAFDEAKDDVHCGPGRDVVTAGLGDQVAADCEVVSRQLSRDPFTEPDAQLGTEVEPDSSANGSVIVTVFQANRFESGGAGAIGFATSANAGGTWHSGFLPGLSPPSRVPAAEEFVSDPTVAYDAAHAMWLAASLTGSHDGESILISRSRDGITWRVPVTAVRTDPNRIDKDWITCDNWRESPHRGSCYLVYRDNEIDGIAVRVSRDGGASWPESATVVGRDAVAPASVNGALPLVRPDGTVLVVFTAQASIPSMVTDRIAVVRSTDGGSTFTQPERIAPLSGRDVFGIRTTRFVSGGVDGLGRVYLAWQGCSPGDCGNTAILVSSSGDGRGWSSPEAVPTVPLGAGVDTFLPGLAVAPASPGSTTRLALAYYTQTPCIYGTCWRIDAGLVTSSDGGRTWTYPQRLNSESMRPAWIADSGLGRMFGDYISMSFAGGKPIAVLPLATAPGAGAFREAVFAITRVAGSR